MPLLIVRDPEDDTSLECVRCGYEHFMPEWLWLSIRSRAGGDRDRTRRRPVCSLCAGIAYAAWRESHLYEQHSRNRRPNRE
jgi:hypothetical protein